jgi:hypothetical protein
MRLILCICIMMVTIPGKAQSAYDSITISRFLINESLYSAKWADTLKAGRFANYLAGEKAIWKKQVKQPERAMGVMAPILSLTERIKTNGTEDVSKCFIPRHSVNYYKGGKIVRYLLVCFECDGLRFSDDPAKKFISNVSVREAQMAELKKIFKEMR